MRQEHNHQNRIAQDGSLGSLLDTCGHYFSHRVGGSKRGRGKVMELIANQPGITQKALGEALGVQPASVSELLMKLERKGLVLRKKDETDRRVIRIDLTAEGLAETERKEEHLDPFQALSAEEQETLKNLLTKLIADWENRYPNEREKHGGHHCHKRHNQKEEGQAD